ncbi:DNA methylase N-4/N-6 [uncultured Caudovirales phage]|uniref:DNA methylase N-4/N-6 n=1 Tax=uncultured Caudovirales phage TaxID=2100421 RepID=A0A6J5NGE4_9CAUD|nr:DNA methylase N-4/N-6 [uncultured Caudovirales phage]
MIELLLGDCRERLKDLPDCSVDSIVTDPPYELGFMGKSWDASGVAYDVTVWRECLRVLKHGGHLLSFGGSRTYHRMACAIEDAGFQIRDQIMWVYGSGFPKSLNISKAIDRAAGAERVETGLPNGMNSCLGGSACKCKTDGLKFSPTKHSANTLPATAEAEVWDGWGTALKPAHEPIVLARKPLVGTVANNVLVHGVGGLNIDGCRVEYPEGEVDFDRVQRQQADGSGNTISNAFGASALVGTEIKTYKENGRFPANFIHDGSDEVLELFPSDKPDQSASRFFYCAKASKKDRNEGLDGMPSQRRASLQRSDRDCELDDLSERFRTEPAANFHPTVKPTDLMRYLCRLVTPQNGTVLDPFTGSGSTGKAAVLEGFNFIGVEQSEEYIKIAQARIESAKK